MSDRYGTMVLTYSDDLVCDFDGLVNTLNQFIWSSDYLIWEKESHIEKTYIYASDEFSNGGLIEHPSIFPKQLEVILKNEDGTLRAILSPTTDEEDDAIETAYRETTLQNLTEAISKNMSNGYIEIACVGHTQNLVYMGRLKVDSNGTSNRTHITRGLDYDYEFSEEYEA